jgi:hypothetical protein
MTAIRAIVTVEDCLDSTAVREVQLHRSVTEELMRRLAEEATLKFYPHFPRPYFRIERRREYVVQGVIGNDSFRVTFLPNRSEGAMEELWARLGGLPPGSGPVLGADHGS